nr:MAG TPA: hypothetical protein [Caudoviricetes sp.]
MTSKYAVRKWQRYASITHCAVGEALHFVAIITYKKEVVKCFKRIFEK